MAALDPMSVAHLSSASFAVWNDDGSSSTDLMVSQRANLHAGAVICGLNRSNSAHDHSWGDKDPFRNFHQIKHQGDSRLRRYIQDGQLTNLQGAYMTDLSDVIETDSAQVVLDSTKVLPRLQSELAHLPPQHVRHVLVMGNKGFDALLRGLGLRPGSAEKDPSRANLRSAEAEVGEEKWFVWRIWLHSNYGHNQHLSTEELPRQLQLVDKAVGLTRAGRGFTAGY